MNRRLIALLLILAAITVIQSFLPPLMVYGINFSPDLFLVFLTFLAVHYGRVTAILFGFVMGLYQDLSTQMSLLGLYAFIKSLSGYTLGSVHNYYAVWESWVRDLVVFGCYIIHFGIYNIIYLYGGSFSFGRGLLLTIIPSGLNMLLYLILRKTIITATND